MPAPCSIGGASYSLPHIALLYRRSSIIREEKIASLKDLPLLKDTALTKREVCSKNEKVESPLRPPVGLACCRSLFPTHGNLAARHRWPLLSVV